MIDATYHVIHDAGPDPAQLELDGAFLGDFVNLNSSGGTFASGLEFGPGLSENDDLYALSSNGTVRRYDGITGDFLQTFSFGTPTDEALHFGPDGDLYIAHTGPMTIRRYDGETGAFIDVFISTGDGEEQISLPYDFAWSPTAIPEPSIVNSCFIAALMGLLIASIRRVRRTVNRSAQEAHKTKTRLGPIDDGSRHELSH